MTAQDRAAKEKVAKAPGETTWMWSTDKPIPPLPQAVRSKATQAGVPIITGALRSRVMRG